MKKRILKIILAVIIIMASVISVNVAQAEEGQITEETEEIEEENLIAISTSYFQDEAFVRYIKETIDKDNDGYLSEREISEVTKMDVSKRDIKSLQGIDIFTELITLDCSGNQLLELDVTTLANLRTLICNNNKCNITVNGDNCFSLPMKLPDGITRIQNLSGATRNGDVFVAESDTVSYIYDAGRGFTIFVEIQVNKFYRDISGAVAEVVPDMVYTGKEQKPFLKLTYDGKKIDSANYKVSYRNNINAGTAYALVTGKNTWKGTKKVSFRIVPKNIKKISLSKIASCSYTGKVKKPSVILKDSKYRLKSGKDYTITYKNNKNIGKATVTIKGIGNYTGNRNASFKIYPQIVKSFKVTAKKADSITLKWKKDSHVTGYRIYQYSTKSKTYKCIKTVKASTTSTTIKKLSPCTVYQFKIRSYKKTGGSNYYSPYSKAVRVRTRFTQPKFKVSSTRKGQAVLSWNKVKKASGLELSYREGKGKYKKIKKVPNKTTNSICLKNLKPEATYTFRMRAYKKVNGKKVYSEYCTKKIKISSYVEDWVENLNIAKNNQQIMIVAANGSSATVSLHNKRSDGSWYEVLSATGNIGRNGLGKTREGDGKTPVGVYGFSVAFGIQPNPGTVLSYTQVDSSYYWVDDSGSAYYNQFVSTNNVRKDWNSAEHISGVGSPYHYVLAINYNSACIPGVGSAIFLHCSNGKATSGCISVPESNMVQILQNVQPGCCVIIDSADGVKNY